MATWYPRKRSDQRAFPPRLSMISKWCSSFHSSALWTLRSSGARHQPNDSYKWSIETYEKYGIRAMISRNQKRWIGRPSKRLSRKRQPRSYNPRDTGCASTRPPAASRRISACLTASLERVRPRQVGGRSGSRLMTPTVSPSWTMIVFPCLTKLDPASFHDASGRSPSR
eukprot:scaffold4000_cov35-Tisochrysis_lutea.AAC.1